MANRKAPPVALPTYFSTQVLKAERFHLRPINKGRVGVSVMGGGCEYCDPYYLVQRPEFPFSILEFVAEGAGKLVINGSEYGLLPGTIFSYGRGLNHRISSDPARPLVKYFLVLEGRGVASLLENRELPPGAVLRVSEPDKIRHIFDDMIGFGLGDRVDREACCVQAAQYLLMMIGALSVPEGSSTARAFATYERCRQYIEENGVGIVSIQEVSTACHVDKAYICRLFQRFGRERPFHYLQHVRMNYAMTQLQTTDRLVKDIAGELKFSDSANFTRTFRRWFGVPPQAIRSR